MITLKTKSKGFTLLEILVAMFIFGVVLTTLYTAYTGTFRNIEETQSLASYYQMARISLDRIVEDLETAYIYPGSTDVKIQEPMNQSSKFIGKDLKFQDRSIDAMFFNSRAHQTFNKDPFGIKMARIGYFFKEVGSDGSFSLFRSDTTEFEQKKRENPEGSILCEDLFSLDFQYIDHLGKSHNEWDSTQDPFKNKLPVIVSITLEFLNKSRNDEPPLRFETAVKLPIAKANYE